MSQAPTIDPNDPTGHPLLLSLPLSKGFRVAPPCVLTKLLGEGAAGVVYQGVHLNLEIDVAVKFLRPEIAREAEHVSRFLREARIAASIRHENLVSVYDTVSRHGHFYTVMELVEGETLHDRVVRKGPLPVPEALTLIAGALRGLSALHKRDVIHRDVKPTNIIVARHGDVKLSDLGIARDLMRSTDTLKTHADALIGTPQYMAPEQFRGADEVRPKSDVFSMAATLAFLLIGDHAIKGSSIAEVMHRICNAPFPKLDAVRPGLPATVVELVRAATLPALDDRPSARQFLDAITRELHVEGVGEVPLDDPNAIASVPTRGPSSKLDRSTMREIASEMEKAPSNIAPSLPATMKEDVRGRAKLYAGLAVAAVVVGGVAWWALKKKEPAVVAGPTTATAPISIPVEPTPAPVAPESPLVDVPSEVTDEVQRQHWLTARRLLASSTVANIDPDTRQALLEKSKDHLWLLVEDGTLFNLPLLQTAGRVALDTKDATLAAEVLLVLRANRVGLGAPPEVQTLIGELEKIANSGTLMLNELEIRANRLDLSLALYRLTQLKPTFFTMPGQWALARRVVVGPFHRIIQIPGGIPLQNVYRSWATTSGDPTPIQAAQMRLQRAKVLNAWEISDGGDRTRQVIDDTEAALATLELPGDIRADLSLEHGIGLQRQGKHLGAIHEFTVIQLIAEASADTRALALGYRAISRSSTGDALKSVQDFAEANTIQGVSDETKKRIEELQKSP
ncbi:MAG: serine/threonine-protein kinase [Tepidisphaeraceae bacterium]